MDLRKEIALSLSKWVPLALGPAAEQKQNETKDSPPGPPPGEGAALFSPSPEKEQTPTSPGCPRQGCFHGHRCTAIALSTWGMPAYPLAAPPSRVVRTEETDERLLAVKGAILDFVSSSCTSGKKGTGAERRLWAAPRSEKPIIQLRGFGTGRSVDLQPDTDSCPGKHGRQLWVRCGGGDNTRGGQPHRTIPRCCNRHPILGWRTEWNAGRHVEWTSEITREPDGTFAAWGVRGPWGRTRRRGSYCYPQISQSASRWFSARARETSAGGSRGCQSFQKGKARSQRSHAHTPTTGAWVIHERNFVGSPDTEDNDRVHQPQTGNDRNQKDTDKTASWKRRDRPWFALLEFALLVEVPRGIAVERDSADCTVTPTRNKTKMNGFVEISTLLIH